MKVNELSPPNHLPSTSSSSQTEYKPKESFPYKEMTILSLAMFASAISMSGLFPYVGLMVVDLDMSDTINTSGYYAGYIAASMMCGRLCSSILWGTMADQVGRKPIISMGCLSIAAFSLLFGLSLNYTMAVVTRFLLGFFNPIIGISKTVVSEVCSKQHESMGMGVMTGCWSLGLIIGPAVGGLLAHPMENYSNQFFPVTIGYFLTQFPYFLPNLVTALFSLLAFVLFVLYFPETLPMITPTPTPVVVSTVGITSSTSSNIQKQHKYTLLRNGSSTVYSSDKNEKGDIKNNNHHSHQQQQGLLHREMSTGVTTVDQQDDDDDEESVVLSPIHQDQEKGNKQVLLRKDTMMSTLSSNTSMRNDNDQTTNNIPALSSDMNRSHASTITNTDTNTTNSSGPNLSLWQLVTMPGIWKILVAYMLISTVSIAVDEVFPLWMMSTPAKGGLSLTSPQVGQIMSLTGFVLILFTFTAYPYISNKLGPPKSYLYGISWGIPLVILISAVRSLQDVLHFSSTVSVSLIITCLISSKIANNLAFSSIALVINQSVPTNKRASINGIAMTVGSSARAIGPIFGSIIFAWSINNDYGFPLDYHFVFLLLSILGVVNVLLFLSYYRTFTLDSTRETPGADPDINHSENISTRASGSTTRDGYNAVITQDGYEENDSYKRRDIELGPISHTDDNNMKNIPYDGAVASNPILQAVKTGGSKRTGYSHLATDDGDTSADDEDDDEEEIKFNGN